jgi:SpoVK/Ycf46/Vps4 family AAA+-type ATPase
MQEDPRHHNRRIVKDARVVLAPEQCGAAARDDSSEGVLSAGEVGVVQGVEATAAGDVVAVVRSAAGEVSAYPREHLVLAAVEAGPRTLQDVVAAGGTAEAELMIEKDGADPHAADEHGMTPLMHACRSAPDAACAAMLLAHGVSLDAVDGEGQTALMKSVLAGTVQTTALLLRAGASWALADARGWTALHHAAHGGHYTCVLELLRRGATCKPSTGRDALSPAEVATHAGHTPLAEELSCSSEDQVFRVLKKYAQAEKKLPFSKAAEWASTQQAEFAQRYGIRCPDRKLHQLSARIPGLQAILDSELLRSFLLRFMGRRHVGSGTPGKQIAKLADKLLKELGKSDCQCQTIEDLRVLSSAAAEGADEGVLALAFEVGAAEVAGGEHWPGTLDALREAIVGEGLGWAPEATMAEPVLLRTSDWMYLTTAAEDGSDRLSLRLEPHGFLGGSQDGPQQHVPWPAGASWTCGRMENGAVMIHASQTGGDSDPNERVYLALNLIVWPSAPANECLRLEAASAANAPDTSTLWRVIENGTELQSIVYKSAVAVSMVTALQALQERRAARVIQRHWSAFRANPAKFAAQGQRESERIDATVAELEHLRSVGVLPDEVLSDMLSACRTGKKSEDVDKRLHQLMTHHAKKRREEVVKERKERSEEAIEICLRDDEEEMKEWSPVLPGVKTLKWQLGWSGAEQLRAYAAFRVQLNLTIGLDPVRACAQQIFSDAVGRRAANEPFHYRHVLLVGEFGTGKRTAAELIGAAATLVGATDPPPLPPGAVKTPDDTTVICIDAFRDLRPPPAGAGIRERSVYYIRHPKRPSDKDEGMLLEKLVEKASFIIMSGTSEEVDTFQELGYMKKDDRGRRIELPTLDVPQLAKITLQLVEAAGYRLRKSDSATDDAVAGLELAVMEYIVRQTYDDDRIISERNAHLANDMLQRAITRKNERIERGGASEVSRLLLTPQDFGVEMQTEEELAMAREEVGRSIDSFCPADEDAQSLIASSPNLIASAPMGPFHFFNTRLQQQIATNESDPQAQAAGSKSSQWNVLITGNAGSGKFSLAQMFSQYLRTHGILTKASIVKRSVLRLQPQDEEVDSLLESKSGGCLYLTLDSEEGDGQSDRLGNQAAVVHNLLLRMENRPVVCVIAGSRASSAHLFRAKNAIALHLHFHIELLDFSPAQLVRICERYATEEKNCTFAPGLTEQLEKHIADVYDDLSSAGNGNLARELVDKADRIREDRVFSSIMGEGGGAAADNPRELIADDFAIGATMVEVQLKDKIDAEIQDLVGMSEAKTWFAQAKTKVKYVERTGDRTALKTCMNLVLTGNPGTGKTSFARLLYRFMRAYGILKSDHEIFIERNGLELKGEFLGESGPKVKRAVSAAMGGCLFVDEAYSLAEGSQDAGGGGDAFSKDAIRTLLTEVENNRTSCLVVLAGYKDKMQRLMRMDPGLDRRFPQRLHIPDYNKGQLAQICQIKARRMFDRHFEDDLEAKLATHIGDFYAREIPQQNAGLSVNLTEGAVERQIERLIAEGAAGSTSIEEDSHVLTASDFGISETPSLGDEEEKHRVLQAVDALVGMDAAKAFFRKIAKNVAYVEQGGNVRLLATSLNMVITGNPGTGKTTIARLIAKYLHAFGVLPRDRFVEKNGLDLKGKYVGHTSHTVKEAISDALGGCLFLDEAYALVDGGGDGFSSEAVRTLLTEVENNRTNLLVVLAGYEDRMITNPDSLMNADAGLPRRFATRLHLDDYSPLELAQMSAQIAEGFGLSFAPGLVEELAEWVRAAHGHEIAKHNGGMAVNLTEQAFRALAERVIDQGLGVTPAASVLTAADFAIGAFAPEGVPAVRDAEAEQQSHADPEAEVEEATEVVSFPEVLAALRIEHHTAALQEESIETLEDLAALTEGNLESLGLKIGERNRVLMWSASKQSESVEAEVVQLRREVGGLRELLVEHGMRVEDEGRRIADAQRRKKAEEEAARRDQHRRGGGGGRGGAAGGVGKAKVKVAAKTKVAEKQQEAVLENPLFAYAGRARKIAFAIDVSGSMLVASPFGGSRMEVVKEHLATALQSMEGNAGAAFGLVTFDQTHHTPLGDSLWPAEPENVSKGLSAVQEIVSVRAAGCAPFCRTQLCRLCGGG